MQSFFNNVFQPGRDLPKLTVTMLGPSGVGKTSLLAAMYDQFDNVSKDLQLLASEETKLLLEPRLNELKNLTKSSQSIKVRGGVKSTDEPRPFDFKFGQTGVTASLEIHFQDYPGEYLEKPGTIEEVQNFVRNSAAVLIPIDTPALMEKEGRYHEYFNKPSQLNELFKNAYKNLSEPRLVILVPVKCEKYLRKDSENLFREVRKGYQKILNQLSSAKLLPKVAVIVAPVQTVGSVVFSRFEKNENNIITIYRKRDTGDDYSPHNTELPLRYLLRFLLKLHFDDKRKNPFHRILEIFGKNASMRNAVSRFAEPNSTDVEIIQGTALFEI